MMGKLIIARHHESEWNKQGRWTGTRDSHLTQYGFLKSEDMGKLIKDLHLDYAFASKQVRSIETLSCMLMAAEMYQLPQEHIQALGERDYGEYTGKNKWEMRDLVGEEKFDSIRRDWDCPIPGGETLKMVYERVVPFYQNVIVPLLSNGKNVLIVAHGNSLRALMIYVESIPTEKARDLEMLFGAIVIYDVDSEGKMTHKEIRQTDSQVHA